MKEFFKVVEPDEVLEYRRCFQSVKVESIRLESALGRILAEEIVAKEDLPPFSRATMDGFAIQAASSFGASESNPAYLTLKGTIGMGETPVFSVGPGEAARIATGGMLPDGADSVIMVEHTEMIDDHMLEVYRSVAPGQHMVQVGEDVAKGETILRFGCRLRFQEIGLLAALGRTDLEVFAKPVIGIISTGDEIVPADHKPGPGQIRDINTYSLSGQVRMAGGLPVSHGIVKDDPEALLSICRGAVESSDMVLISGGSSVGMRDFTVEVLHALPDSEILVHGVSISPGKPTILARVGGKAFWGMPGHVVSAMVVFTVLVRPFINRLSGVESVEYPGKRIRARLTRAVASAQGRVDYVRVKLTKGASGQWFADPILGTSAIIRTMLEADGLMTVDLHTEGVDKGAEVEVMVLQDI